MTQLYEIRNEDTGWKLLANATERQVRKFFEANSLTESKNRKIDGVIVIYVKSQQEKACIPNS